MCLFVHLVVFLYLVRAMRAIYGPSVLWYWHQTIFLLAVGFVTNCSQALWILVVVQGS